MSLIRMLKDILKAIKTLRALVSSGENYLYVGNMLIQWGYVISSSVSAYSAANITFTFPKSYAVAPTVIGQLADATELPNLFYAFVNASKTSETKTAITFRNQYSAAVSLRAVWIAIGKWK